jgi:hypothetical protein
MVALEIRYLGTAVAHGNPGVKLDTTRSHDVKAAVKDGLFHLEFGNAVTKKTANSVTTFIDAHGVTHTA